MNKDKVKSDILEALDYDPRVSGIHVTFIDVDDSEVVLEGTAPNEQASLAAQYDAWAVARIGKIKNQLRVVDKDHLRVPANEQLKDRAQSLFGSFPELNTNDIFISAEPGKILLDGSVKEYSLKKKAEEVAFLVDGVMEVINRLAIVPADNPIDQSIGRKLTDYFYKNINFDVNTVHALIQDGNVKVFGYIPNEKDIRTIIDFAYSLHGVVHVDEELKIDPSVKHPIERMVTLSLKRTRQK
jgi:osmotically-inducible protein OsmY